MSHNPLPRSKTNYKRGIFRIWMISSVLFTLAVGAISYSAICDELKQRNGRATTSTYLRRNSAGERCSRLTVTRPVAKRLSTIRSRTAIAGTSCRISERFTLNMAESSRRRFVGPSLRQGWNQVYLSAPVEESDGNRQSCGGGAIWRACSWMGLVLGRGWFSCADASQPLFLRGVMPRLYELKDRTNPDDPEAYFHKLEESLTTSRAKLEALLKRRGRAWDSR